MSLRPPLIAAKTTRWRLQAPEGQRGGLAILLALALSFSSLAAAQSSSSSSNQTYTITGTVVNSVTGEPIPRALVRTNGMVQRTAFTDSEGHFQIDGLPAMRVNLVAQKPGYTLPDDNFHSWFQVNANTPALVLKLAPQSAIYGRVTDQSGQPIEHMPLHLTARSLHDGRKMWEQRAMAESDEDGHFRFPNLVPGTYYVAAGPLDSEARILVAGEKAKTGFPHLYYPGVPDLTSAQPIQLSAGQQMETDFSLGTVPIYQISGTVAGRQPDQGVGFQLLTSSGDDISPAANFNMDTGTFKMDDVPAGSYIVRAISQAGIQPMRAETRVNVATNVEDLRLTLAPTVTIPIVVRMEARSSSSSAAAPWTQDHPPLSVRLIPADPNLAEQFSTYQQSNGHSTLVLQNIDPGTYTAVLMPQPPWYVQSASYAQTNVLYDDVLVSSGQSYPMEVALRDDSASVNATVKSSDGSPVNATVVVVPQPAGKMTPHVSRGGGNEFSVSGLAPGDYLVFAFDRIDDLEYANPDAYAPYASQAAHVTLTPNQKAQVSLDLISVGRGN